MGRLKKSNKHPAVYQYENTKGKFWGYRLKYQDVTGKRKEIRGSKFSSEEDAVEKIIELQYEINKGSRSDAKKITVSEWFIKYLDMNKPNESGENGQWADNTYRGRLNVHDKYIKDTIGHIRLDKLTLPIYQELYIEKMKETLSASTIELYHTYVEISLNAAIRYKLIKENPVVGATIPEDRRVQDDKFIEPEQLKTVLNDIEKNENITNNLVIRFLAFTGVRVGEMRALRWKNINFKKKTAQIYATLTGRRYGKTKGKKKRIIPLDNQLLEDLKLYMKWCVKRRGGILNEDDYVFISPQKGDVIGDTTLVYVFKRSYKRTGIKVSAHTFRHTHSAILIMQNRSLKAISKRLGNTEEVLNMHYGHVIDSVDLDTMNAFSDAMANLDKGAKTGAENKTIAFNR